MIVIVAVEITLYPLFFPLFDGFIIKMHKCRWKALIPVSEFKLSPDRFTRLRTHKAASICSELLILPGYE